MNPTEICEALEAIAREPFNPETFGAAFAEATDNPRATVSKLRAGSINRSDLPGGMLHNRKFHFAPAPAGAVEQTLAALRDSRRTEKYKPAILIATDGETISAEHRASGDTLHFPWAEIGDHFGFMLPAANKERYRPAEENPVDVKAAGKLARLYDAILRADPEWAEPDCRHAMNQFMTRLVFCLFAEKVEIFTRNQFSAALFTHGGDRGEHAREVIVTAFTAMNAKPDARGALPAWARAIPYVNGGLFAAPARSPSFDVIAWRTLRDLSALEWGEINPDIFGSMIQSVADPAKRAELGMHYTSVPNIMKAIGPLFLDEIDEAIEKAADRPRALRRLLDRIARIRVFDPACGSGNFLVVAYRELRAREARILARMHALTGQMEATWSALSLTRFYGVEIDDFAAETAKLALFIAEAQANARHAGAFGVEPARLPLKDGARILCDNALRLDWEAICPPPSSSAVETDLAGATGRLALDDQGEVFIVGNPPFVGTTYRTDEQREDLAYVLSHRIDSFGRADFVTAWLVLAADYARRQPCRAALIATSSVVQGSSVAPIWGEILRGGLRVIFAHRPFKWRNSAADNAAVECVVVGLGKKASRLSIFEGEAVSVAANINAYLIDGPDVFVAATRRPLFGLPDMSPGNFPYDFGNLILSPEERAALLAEHPEAEPFVRRFIGSREGIHGADRYCLWIPTERRAAAEAIDPIRRRIAAVAQKRAASKDAGTRRLAARPHQFREFIAPERHMIVMPRTSSEKREWLPVHLTGPNVISSDNNHVIVDGPEWLVAILASKLHLLWIATVCGKLEARFRYSNTLGWNTFPVPDLTAARIASLERSTRAILRARYEHHPASLAKLYDSETMPDTLRDAHRTNDALIETMYAGRPFRSDAERLEHLFRLYVARASETEAA